MVTVRRRLRATALLVGGIALTWALGFLVGALVHGINLAQPYAIPVLAGLAAAAFIWAWLEKHVR